MCNLYIKVAQNDEWEHGEDGAINVISVVSQISLHQRSGEAVSYHYCVISGPDHGTAEQLFSPEATWEDWDLFFAVWTKNIFI